MYYLLVEIIHRDRASYTSLVAGEKCINMQLTLPRRITTCNMLTVPIRLFHLIRCVNGFNWIRVGNICLLPPKERLPFYLQQKKMTFLFTLCLQKTTRLFCQSVTRLLAPPQFDVQPSIVPISQKFQLGFVAITVTSKHKIILQNQQ